MFEVTKLIRFADGVDESERETVLSGGGVRRRRPMPGAPDPAHAAGGIAAGDVIARFRFDVESDWRAAQNDVERTLVDRSGRARGFQ
ncbi:hypothetical protein GS493_07655 [Rhodococcus hoagii]|nr:hypothetical protein [Prescottella equi]